MGRHSHGLFRLQPNCIYSVTRPLVQLLVSLIACNSLTHDLFRHVYNPPYLDKGCSCCGEKQVLREKSSEG